MPFINNNQSFFKPQNFLIMNNLMKKNSQNRFQFVSFLAFEVGKKTAKKIIIQDELEV